MAVHLVGKVGTATIRLKSTPRFEGIREVKGTVKRSAQRSDKQRLLDAQITCQTGGPSWTGAECLECPRYAGWRPGPGDRDVTVRCCWSDEDPVSARMTRASTIVAVTPATPCSAAAELARRHGVHHLPVIAKGAMVGILCAHDLERSPEPDQTVAERMNEEILGIRPEATLGEAVAAMRLFRVGCLPVVADRLLVGLITHRDLRRAGVPERLLGTRRCAHPEEDADRRISERGEPE
jgi:CBS domain-containing protein